jgi:hypothetical protein
MRRRTRLRSTARRSVRAAIDIPSRALSKPFGRTLAVKSSLPRRWPLANALLNSAGRRRRRPGGNLRSGAVKRVAAFWRLMFGLRSQALATLGAPATQYLTAVLRGHTGPKSVRARAAHFARLIRAFHEFKALKTWRKTGRAGYAAACCVSIRDHLLTRNYRDRLPLQIQLSGTLPMLRVWV